MVPRLKGPPAAPHAQFLSGSTSYNHLDLDSFPWPYEVTKIYFLKKCFPLNMSDFTYNIPQEIKQLHFNMG